MIQGLSKAVALYLAPLLSLTSLVLSLLVFLAPNVTLHTQVSLLTVTPSTVLRSVSTDEKIDGPAVWMGVIGSCSRSNKAAQVACTTPDITPQYDLSVLSGKSPSLLTAPTTATPAFIALALVCTVFFFALFTLVSLRHKMGKFGSKFEKPMLQRVVAWVGLFGFMFGLSSFLIIRLWFGKAIEDFNKTAMSDNDDMLAEIGNGFIMIWVAYAFYAVPLVCSLATLHSTTSAGKGGA